VSGGLVGVTNQWRKAEAARARVTREAYSYELILGLERVISVLKDAETGGRGYVIAGKEAFLEPYRDALANYDRVRMNLRRLVDGDVPPAAAPRTPSSPWPRPGSRNSSR
jgi:CHASE3 domain sensor protein